MVLVSRQDNLCANLCGPLHIQRFSKNGKIISIPLTRTKRERERERERERNGGIWLSFQKGRFCEGKWEKECTKTVCKPYETFKVATLRMKGEDFHRNE